MSRLPPRASGYFRVGYRQDLALVETRTQRFSLAVLVVALLAFPFVASPFQIDLASQVFFASIGALSLMLLTGIAGQVSLGHAGLLAAGAFTTGILYKEFGASPLVTLPASAVAGAVLGVVFGLPSLRLRGLYLAVSTLALHFVVIYLAGEYEANRGLSAGILVDPPVVFGVELYDPRIWYFILLGGAGGALVICLNLLRSRSGRAWHAIRSREAVAEALGISITRYKLLAFVVSSAMTAVAGSLFAYYRGFVSVEAFSLYLTIQYFAMVIIGGIGSMLGAVLGAIFVTLFPHLIEAAVRSLPGAEAHASQIFAVNYAAFGLLIILFLVLEPEGMVGIWRRVQSYFQLWPFRHQPLSSSRR